MQLELYLSTPPLALCGSAVLNKLMCGLSELLKHGRTTLARQAAMTSISQRAELEPVITHSTRFATKDWKSSFGGNR